ncbi:hypothetical protein AB0M20_35820, partial [Actinoplanes sp. NPDC051633]|uniref:hypothetical protein n=1 Tax=Actinoplanes sp. NPDC051633 TaxID=3155670 RepID=UPI00343081DD
MILLDTSIFVHYRFLNLHSESADHEADPGVGMRGQVNGLCGAAVPGALSMVTGTHTGDVHVTIELHEAEPPLGEIWDEVVEVPFAGAADDLVLSAFQDTTEPINLPPGNYRARYCVRGMAEADTTDEPDEHVLLQFWPSADRIVRRTSDFAGYWHDTTRALPPLPERVAAVGRSRARRLADEEAAEEEEWRGGDVPEDERVRESGFEAAELMRTDVELATALADAPDELRREVAIWAVEDALRAARAQGEPWAVRGLAALRRGGDLTGAFDRLFTMPDNADASVMSVG